MSSSTNMPTRIGPRACRCASASSPLAIATNRSLCSATTVMLARPAAPSAARWCQTSGLRLSACERRAKSLWRPRKRPQPQLPQPEPFLEPHPPNDPITRHLALLDLSHSRPWHAPKAPAGPGSPGPTPDGKWPRARPAIGPRNRPAASPQAGTLASPRRFPPKVRAEPCGMSVGIVPDRPHATRPQAIRARSAQFKFPLTTHKSADKSVRHAC